jgi:hypothetical protein
MKLILKVTLRCVYAVLFTFCSLRTNIKILFVSFLEMLEVKELSNENRLNYAKRRFEEAGKLRLTQQSQTGEKRKHNSSSSSISKPSDEVQVKMSL